MADDFVAPRASAANISRRALLAGAAGIPIVSVTAVPPASSDWDRAFDAFAATHHRYEAFVADALQPAYDSYNAELDQVPDSRAAGSRKHLLSRHGLVELEEQGDDLLSARHDALHRLLLVPAPDREAALLKMRLSYREIFRHDDEGGLIRAIFADIERQYAGASARSHPDMSLRD